MIAATIAVILILLGQVLLSLGIIWALGKLGIE